MQYAVTYREDTIEYGPPGHESVSGGGIITKIIDKPDNIYRYNPIKVQTFPGGEDIDLKVFQDIYDSSQIDNAQYWYEKKKGELAEYKEALDRAISAQARVEKYIIHGII